MSLSVWMHFLEWGVGSFVNAWHLSGFASIPLSVK